MAEITPFYILLFCIIAITMKVIENGKILVKQEVSFAPGLNGFYYAIGLLALLMSPTMFNMQGLIYHRLMTFILLILSAIFLIPSIFVRPTKNSIIATIIGTALGVGGGLILYFFIEPSAQDAVLYGVLVFVVGIIIGSFLVEGLNRLNPEGAKVLFYKEKLWKFCCNIWLLSIMLILLVFETILQVNGSSLLFFLPF